MNAHGDNATAHRDQWQPISSPVTHGWLLSELKAERATEVASRETTLFDELAGRSGASLVLFGAGNLGRRVLRGLRRNGVEPLAFADNSAQLQGSEVEGLLVYSPADAVACFPEAAFVVAVWVPLGPLAYPGISRQLADLGCRRVVNFVPLFWKYAEEFLPYYILDLPHYLYENADAVRRAYELFQDEESRSEYLLELSYLLSMMDTVEVPRPVESDWYFPRELFSLGEDEVFVDCGAYDGDTLSFFLEASSGRLGEIIAFEPDPLALRRLESKVRDLPEVVRERVSVVPKAVGACAGVLHFESDGSPGSRVSDAGGLVVECVRLDDALAGKRPTLIKMDIEGAEKGALEGAARTIRASRPVLAICIYHEQSDLYRLPLMISAMCPDYALFIRRQGDDGDLICFAIPPERMLP